MPTFNAVAAVPGGGPGPWGPPSDIAFDRRDVLLYAVGIGAENLRFTFEGHPDFAVFPTFPIRWGGRGLAVDSQLVPASPGPLSIDAERYLEFLRPLPTSGVATARSRLIAVHPRGKGSALVEAETIVTDAAGEPYVRMIGASFRRGIEALGDIEPFEGAGQSFSSTVAIPARSAELQASARIGVNQAQIYRLSGDYNPLHIDPAAARFGGFDRPILHGLCTLGYCANLLLELLCDGNPTRFRRIKVRFSAPVYPGDELLVRAWHDGDGRVAFEARVGNKAVVSNAFFEFG